jgi:23S rRNA (uracil1939-C5)-methyltransferase
VDPSKTWSIFLRIQQAIKGQPTEFFEMALYGPEFYREELHMDTVLKLSVSPTAFFQPNTLQAEVLYKIALNMIPQPEGKVFYDLYAGTGTLGLAIASVAAQVIAIELSPESSLDARENAKANKLSNYRCYTGDVGSVLKEKKGDLPLPDAVVVDPPRAGLNPEAIEQIAELKAPYIIYIACNPATQAMNCREFMEKGYQIVKIQPVDQFPQTPHCENIVFLAKEVF